MIRLLLVFWVSLALLAPVALAEGEYQKTRDGKTTVWNSEPQAGDEATWSGGRDDAGYAKSFGTLTWYSIPGKSGRAADASNNKPTVFARYFGNMVRGKFDGPVNVHSRNRTNYAIFVEGDRMTRWATGTAPQRAWAQHRTLIAAKKEKEPAAPAEGPVTRTRKVPAAALVEATVPPKAPAKPSNIEQRTSNIESEEARPSAKAKTKPPEKTQPPPASSPSDWSEPAEIAKAPVQGESSETDSSLQLLTGPPTSLRDAPPTPEPQATEAPVRLTTKEVVDLADGAARSHGLNPAEFNRAEPKYNAQDETWSLSYGRNGGDEFGRGFSITIDDKTKGTVFVPAK